VRVLLLAAAFGCGDNLGGGHPGGPACDACPDAGVSVDAGPLAAFCDDGNACTADVLDESGCHSEPVEDDTPCEDGDLCSLGDHCAAGACVAGARAEGDLAVLGTLDNLSGRRIGLGPDRFAVVTIQDLFRGRVQVVRRTVSGLETVSSWAGELTFVISGDDDILASAVPADGLLAVTAVGERTLRLFSLSDDEVAARGQLELSNQVNSLSAHGDRVWLCTGNPFVGYQVTLVDVADPDAPVEVGGMGLGATPCGSTAVNQDGKRVYVNTAAGVRYVDAAPLDTGGDPTLSEIIAPTSGVSVSGDRLLLIAPTAVRILAEPSLDELATVPVERARAAALFGDRLLIEGNRPVGGDSEVFVRLYDSSGTPSLLDEAVLASYIGEPVAGTFKSASDGATLLTRTRAFDLTGDRLDELRVPQLLPLRTLARSGADGLRAYHASGAAAIDTSDPAAPVYIAGGAFAAPRPILTVAIDDSTSAAAFASGLGQGLEDPTRVLLDRSNPYFPDPLRIDRWTLDATADLVAEDWFSLEHQGSSQLLIAGDFLYRYQRPGAAGDTRFQSYWLPALRGGITAVPVFDRAVTAASTLRRGFDVDLRARVAVVSTDEPVDGGDPAPVLLFYDLAASPPALIARVPASGVFDQLRVSGTRVVTIGLSAIVFYDSEHGEVSRIPFEDRFESQLLAFDGNTAYVGFLHIVPGTATYELAAADFGSSDPPVFVEVNALPRSLVAQRTSLAVGFDTQVVTVHPHCP